MKAVESTVATRQGGDRRNGETAGSLRRRKTLPGGRAVVGGFLVALAGVGVFAGYTNATADTRVEYLVARDDLALGQRISRSSLGYLPMDLPDLVRSRSFRDPEALIGAVVLGPVSKGELIQASDVLIRSRAPAIRQMSFSIESARAVDGELQRGELVDVLVTYGTGNEAYTVTAARALQVVNRRQPRGTLGDGRDEVITLAVPTNAQRLALAHAVSTGIITLVRTAGAAGDDGGATGGESYEPPGPGGPAPSEEASVPDAAPPG